MKAEKCEEGGDAVEAMLLLLATRPAVTAAAADTVDVAMDSCCEVSRRH